MTENLKGRVEGEPQRVITGRFLTKEKINSLKGTGQLTYCRRAEEGIHEWKDDVAAYHLRSIGNGKVEVVHSYDLPNKRHQA